MNREQLLKGFTSAQSNQLNRLPMLKSLRAPCSCCHRDNYVWSGYTTGVSCDLRNRSRDVKPIVPKEDLLIGALSGAFIVMSGALYALLFALGQLRQSSLMRGGAYLAYGALVIFSLLLLRALGLEGPWSALVVVMLVGYFFAPRAIWHLSVGTHGEVSGGPAQGSRKPAEGSSG
jgi:hypothetical protein